MLSHIRSSIVELEWSSFTHIFRELNLVADELSKEALSLDVGAFISQEYFDGCICDKKSFNL
jgi:hypothetical protein